MIILYLISVWGGEPVKVDEYRTMAQCQAAMAGTKADQTNAWYYREVCVPSYKATEGQ